MEKNIKFLLKHKFVIGGALSVAVIALLIAVSGSKSKGKTPASASAPPPANVEVAEVKQESVPIYSEWIGTLDGMVNAEIRAQVMGYLLRQNYKEGSFVRKGQLLFE
ncbi:MAG TPA: efflux transporter periplasmic adaptor subunit, partial [Blastocatellia bacterium]